MLFRSAFGANFAALLCYFLLGCAAIAVCEFCSGLTENQIIAAVMGFSVQAKGHEYWGSDLSGLGESYDDFNSHLVDMENTLRNMVEIMILNGLIERN